MKIDTEQSDGGVGNEEHAWVVLAYKRVLEDDGRDARAWLKTPRMKTRVAVVWNDSNEDEYIRIRLQLLI